MMKKSKRTKKSKKNNEIVYKELYKNDQEPKNDNSNTVSKDSYAIPDNISVNSVSSRLTKISKSAKSFNQSGVLSEFGIKPDDGLLLWPYYFNLRTPKFNKKTYRQILTFKFLENLLIDHKNGSMPYLSWNQDSKERNKRIFHFDLSKVGYNHSIDFNVDYLNEKYIQLFELLEDIPEDVIGSLNIALDLYYNKIMSQHKDGTSDSRIQLKIEGYNQSSKISNLSSRNIGKLIKLQGEVIKVESQKILVKKVEYKCKECNEKQEIFLKDGILKKPTSCLNNECENKFAFYLNKQKSECGVYQRITISESLHSSNLNDKNIRPELIVEVRDNLFKNLKLNQILTVTGVLKTEISQNAKAIRNMKNVGFFDTYLLANNIQKQSFILNKKFNIGKLSRYRKLLLHNLNSNDLIFPILIRSYAPEIFGQFFAKACLILSIIGGSSPEMIYKKHFAGSAEMINQKVLKDLGFRDSLHCLLLGEPGNGMTSLLKFCQKLFPKSNKK